MSNFYRNDTFDFSISDVIDLVGLRPVNPTIPFGSHEEQYFYCPVCGSKKLSVNCKKNTYRCNKCGDFKGGMLSLYMFKFGGTKSEAVKALNKYVHGKSSLHIESGRNKSYDRQRIVKEETVERTANDLDRVYRTFLSLLSLSANHKKDLIKRGLSEENIEKYMFKSVPLFNNKNIIAKMSSMNIDFKGVPGFYYDERTHSWCVACNKNECGYFIPIFNLQGQIVALKIRLDKVINAKKYIWLSSKGLNQGVTSGSPISFINEGREDDKNIVLTEGPLKGIIAGTLTRKNFLAVGGVNAQQHLEDTLKYLKKKKGITTLYDAFDADCVSNTYVEKARQQVKEKCNNVGIQYKRLVWSVKEGKGIDDFLLNRKHLQSLKS